MLAAPPERLPPPAIHHPPAAGAKKVAQVGSASKFKSRLLKNCPMVDSDWLVCAGRQQSPREVHEEVAGQRHVGQRQRRFGLALTGSSAGAPLPAGGTPPLPGSAPPADQGTGQATMLKGRPRQQAAPASRCCRRRRRHPAVHPPVFPVAHSSPGCWDWPPGSAAAFRRRARTFCRAGSARSISIAGLHLRAPLTRERTPSPGHGE